MTEFFDIVGTKKRRYYPCNHRVYGYKCSYLLSGDTTNDKCDSCGGNLVRCDCQFNAGYCVYTSIIGVSGIPNICQHFQEFMTTYRLIYREKKKV